MSDVAVVMAWNDPGAGARRDACKYVSALYRRMALGQLWFGTAEPFTKARALNAVIAQLPPGTIIVQSDPDSFLPREASYREAIRLADAQPGLVVPFERYRYLTEHATEHVIAWPYQMDAHELAVLAVDEEGYGGVGNVTVFSKETWAQAGGYDERFPMWGGDDAAFRYACDALVAPTRRLPGDAVHLFHPRLPISIPGGPGYVEQFAIVAEYRDAAEEGPEAVRALVENRGS